MNSQKPENDLFSDGALAVQIPAPEVPDLPEPVLRRDGPLATVWQGDALTVLRAMPANSVDSIVTDPPYGLGFMGKGWDALPPGREWAEECLRVLKPGGHMLAFGGSRTWHRLAVAIEDAGFELRDSIAWMYGSGFPKSLDVSKAIDKARVEDKEPTRVICRAVRVSMDARGLKSRDLVHQFGDCNPRLIDHWAARDTDSQPALPKWDQWEILRDMFGELAELDGEVWRLNGRKGTPGQAWDQREITGHVEDRRGDGTVIGLGHSGELNKATSEIARRWAGWGTALKPAFEPIVVARKPLIGTVAANVLQHGTGGLNIGGCRSETRDRTDYGLSRSTRTTGNTYGAASPVADFDASKGRWPANVILDESQAAVLDGESGTDGPSRFFYVAKAPKSERPVVDGIAHPTVKPLALMRWCVRLVTPPAGKVLDTFAGSGTTAEAAILEGFDVTVIEMTEEYLPLIDARVDRALMALEDPTYRSEQSPQ